MMAIRELVQPRTPDKLYVLVGRASEMNITEQDLIELYNRIKQIMPKIIERRTWRPTEPGNYVWRDTSGNLHEVKFQMHSGELLSIDGPVLMSPVGLECFYPQFSRWMRKAKTTEELIEENARLRNERDHLANVISKSAR